MTLLSMDGLDIRFDLFSTYASTATAIFITETTSPFSHVPQSISRVITTSCELKMVSGPNFLVFIGLILAIEGTIRSNFSPPSARTFESLWCNSEARGSFQKRANVATEAAVFPANTILSKSVTF
jgi:hypothetical protein